AHQRRDRGRTAGGDPADGGTAEARDERRTGRRPLDGYGHLDGSALSGRTHWTVTARSAAHERVGDVSSYPAGRGGKGSEKNLADPRAEAVWEPRATCPDRPRRYNQSSRIGAIERALAGGAQLGRIALPTAAAAAAEAQTRSIKSRFT